MDGRMTYTCVFNKDKECPVKKEYKLTPESLVSFCKVCADLQRMVRVAPPNLEWYEFLKDKGYPSNLTDFINECVEAYFKSMGLELALVVKPQFSSEKKDLKLERKKDERS